MKPSFIVKTAKKQKITSIQRLGYLLDEIGQVTLSNSLYKTIEKKEFKEIPLSLAHSNRVGKSDKKWKIIINTELDLL